MSGQKTEHRIRFRAIATQISRLACIGTLALLLQPAAAQTQELNDDALAEVTGQALIDVVNTTFTSTPKHFIDVSINPDNDWRRLDRPQDVGKVNSRIDPATGRTIDDGYSIDGWPEYYDSSSKSMKNIAGPINFSKIRIGADINIDADIGKLYLGGTPFKANEDCTVGSGCTLPTDGPSADTRGGWDLRQESIKWTGYRDNPINILGIGYPNPYGQYHPFHLKNPYFEIASRTDPAGKREVLGFRFGFEEMDGMFGVNFLTGTGRGFVTSNALGGLATATSTNYGRRSSGDNLLLQRPHFLDGLAAFAALFGIGDPIFPIVAGDKGLTHTDALCVGRTPALGTCSASSEPTRDFWISVSKVDRLLYPSTNPNENFPAQSGVWLNLADNVRAYNVKGMTGLFAISNTYFLDPNVRPKRW